MWADDADESMKADQHARVSHWTANGGLGTGGLITTRRIGNSTGSQWRTQIERPEDGEGMGSSTHALPLTA